VKHILFEKAVLNRVNGYVDPRGHAVELGGILLGLRRADCIHVTDCTFPGQTDQSSRNRFFRRAPSHQEIASKAWEGSEQKIDWVGEWHTHPETQPTPSAIDKRTWASQTRSRNSTMTYFIVGTTGSWIGICSQDARIRNLLRIGESDSRILFSAPVQHCTV